MLRKDFFRLNDLSLSLANFLITYIHEKHLHCVQELTLIFFFRKMDKKFESVNRKHP